MNERQKVIVSILKTLIAEIVTSNRELTIAEITQKANLKFADNGVVGTISPRLVGSYLKRFLNIKTERRGHLNRHYPILVLKKKEGQSGSVLS